MVVEVTGSDGPNHLQDANIQLLFTDIFLDSHEIAPKEITLDIGATDIKAHGHQENSFFHGYYEERCFLPLYIFCGHHLLLAQLRPSNIDGARGSRNVIRCIIKMIRNRWPWPRRVIAKVEHKPGRSQQCPFWLHH